jgi:phosphoribosylformimino-5-aminoimidazole carboxamide ribotide isomerase
VTEPAAFDLLPAVDLRQGQVVRLRQGDDERRTVYGEDPLAALDAFAGAGARWVHVVDLDAAFGEPPQRSLVETLAARAGELGLSLELGGGLRDRASVAWALDAGCTRVIVGSLLARDFEAFASLVEELPNRIVPGLDFKDGRLAVAGWTETADLDVPRLGALLRGFPCPAALVTDVARDGEMAGPNFDLAVSVARATGIPALLSGGIHTLDDLRRAGTTPEISGAVVGRALYDGSFTLAEALKIKRP